MSVGSPQLLTHGSITKSKIVMSDDTNVCLVLNEGGDKGIKLVNTGIQVMIFSREE